MIQVIMAMMFFALANFPKKIAHIHNLKKEKVFKVFYPRRVSKNKA